MIIKVIKICLAIFLANQSVVASSHEHNGHKVCRRLHGKIRTAVSKDSFTKEEGLGVQVCVFNFTSASGGSMTATVDPRMWKSNTIAGSVLSHGPINPSVFRGPDHIRFVGIPKACAALGGVTGGVLDGDLHQTTGSDIFDLCVFADTSFISFWTLKYASISVLTGSNIADFRRILRPKIPVFKQVQPKTSFNNVDIYFPDADLATCRKHSECHAQTACDNQATTRCHHNTCVSDGSDSKCTVDSDCTRSSYLTMHYRGHKGYCVDSMPLGVSCVQGQCVPNAV